MDPVPKGLNDLEEKLGRDLTFLNIPGSPWTESEGAEKVFDVIIIGAGMAGLAAAFALLRLGITNIKLIDCNSRGAEGPWSTYARMKTLRSTKELTGPAFCLPNLTFRAWYEAQFGYGDWESLSKISTQQWMDYLSWFRKVLQLPVENNSRLLTITPDQSFLRLVVQKSGVKEQLLTQKLVLATGRGGFGGTIIPPFMQDIAKKWYAHTDERIDFNELIGKRLCVIGAGAAGFDAAATALEVGAQQVEMLIRRAHLPNINKFASITYAGFTEGYYHLGNEERLKMMSIAFDAGPTPPVESLIRINNFKNVKLTRNTTIKSVKETRGVIEVETNWGVADFDSIILATGYAIEGRRQPELLSIIEKIRLWGDLNSTLSPLLEKNPAFRNFPYLGPAFEFLEKNSGEAPFLKNIHCFNYASTLSHGLLSSDIPGIGAGADRLAKGIASHFFSQDKEKYIERLNNYRNYEFYEEDYPFIR